MSTRKLATDEILFTGGLDSDSDLKFVQQGDYVDALNITKFYDGSGGVVSNASGNTELENTYLPAGTNKCIGWCLDDENNGIIFFNYNSNDDHGIYRYLKDSDVFQKILDSESILAFSSDTIILQANVVGGLLYWNEGKDINGDYINVPRKLNITKAYNYTNAVSTTNLYDSITADTLSAIKSPLMGDINAMLGYDASITSYNFNNSTYYQFALELVFDDNERSVLSNRSNVIFIYGKGASYNYAYIRFLYNDIGDTVSTINVYYTDDLSGNFILSDSIDVSSPENVYDANNNNAVTTDLVDGTYYCYRFYGKGGGAYYDGESTKIYDYLPINTNSQTFTDNRMFYGGTKMSYDKEDVSVTFEAYAQPTGELSTVSIAVLTSGVVAGLKLTSLDDDIYTLLDPTTP